MGLQQMRTRIPRFIEDDANTPHKTGDFPPYIANDVGLIELRRAAWWLYFLTHTIAGSIPIGKRGGQDE